MDWKEERSQERDRNNIRNNPSIPPYPADAQTPRPHPATHIPTTTSLPRPTPHPPTPTAKPLSTTTTLARTMPSDPLLARYTAAFSKLRTDKNSKKYTTGKAPHNATLLLSILTLHQSDRIDLTNITITQDLLELWSALWSVLEYDHPGPIYLLRYRSPSGLRHREHYQAANKFAPLVISRCSI